MNALSILATAAAGWLAGGAGNWAAERLPDRPESGGAGSSHQAHNLLHFWTLPWYFLRGGICPHCGERRTLRAPLLEAGVIAVFLLAWWRHHPNPLHMTVVCLYAAFLLTVLVIDLEHRRVLNVMLLPAAVAAAAASFLPGEPQPLDALIGGAVGFGAFFVLALVGRGAMGMGDVKLAGVIGLMVGYPLVIPALVLGIMLGGVGAVVLLITRRATRKSAMAYAPYLALGALAVMLLVR